MTTPSGTLGLYDVNIELLLAGTTTITMNDAGVRTLAGAGGSGTAIDMNSLRGKSNRVVTTITIAANTLNYSFTTASIPGYIAGKTDATLLINPGVWVYSQSTASPALSISGFNTASGDTVRILNQGYIAGCGGGDNSVATGINESGGTAITTSNSITIDNTYASAYIGGGGGSGDSPGLGAGGGGAGGGRPVGGAYVSPGSNGTGTLGGMVFPSTATAGGSGTPSSDTGISFTPTTASGGSGGSSYYSVVVGKSSTSRAYNADGGGGGWGAAGGNSSYLSVASFVAYTIAGGTGGGPGTAGTTGYVPTGATGQAPGSGGKSVALNGNTVTWVSGNTTRVYGGIS